MGERDLLPGSFRRDETNDQDLRYVLRGAPDLHVVGGVLPELQGLGLRSERATRHRLCMIIGLQKESVLHHPLQTSIQEVFHRQDVLPFEILVRGERILLDPEVQSTEDVGSLIQRVHSEGVHHRLLGRLHLHILLLRGLPLRLDSPHHLPIQTG